MHLIHRLTWVVAVLLLPTTLLAEDEVATDLAKLQGTWLLVSAEESGQDQTDDMTKKLSIVVKDNVFSFIYEGVPTTINMKVKLDPAQKPKTVDLHSTTRKVGPAPGIYMVDGETLKLCWGRIGAARPTEFATKAGDKHIFLTLRKKPEPKKP